MSIQKYLDELQSKKKKYRMSDKIENDGNYVWVDQGNSFSIAPKVEPKLPAGCYVVDSTMDGRNIFTKQDVTTDDLIVVEDSTSEKIVKEIKDFWNLKERFKEYGFIHKRGILLAGPPGGGKTVTLNLVVNTVINEWDGIAIYVGRPFVAAKCLKDLRTVEKDRPVVCIIEDIDETIQVYGESLLLDLLDGGQQIENVVFIATTNHVEKLEDRIVNRPSRFDTVVFVHPPADNLRYAFLKKKAPDLTEDELNHWTKISAGLSFAHMKEMVIMVKCFGKDVDEVADRLKNMDVKSEAKNFDVDNKKNPIGFVTNKNDDRSDEPRRRGTDEDTLPGITTPGRDLSKEFNK